MTAELQGLQDLELVDGEGRVLVRMVEGPVAGLEPCAPGQHCVHHCDSPHPCCRCGAKFERVKRCSCGRTYDSAGWKALPFVGVHGDSFELFEMRNCSCKSTLSMPLEDLTSAQRYVLLLLAEHGAVFPGTQLHMRGYVYLSTLQALERRGLLALHADPSGVVAKQVRGAS